MRILNCLKVLIMEKKEIMAKILKLSEIHINLAVTAEFLEENLGISFKII